jgi:hypothetical protein
VLLIAQITCAVHAGRTGRPFFWIYLIVFVPLMGMLAYIAVELLPDLLKTRTAQQAASGVAKAFDPGKKLREALMRLEITPTAGNRAAVADAYLVANQPEAAIAQYRAALTGVHATDPGMMLGLAHAHFTKGDYTEVQTVLEQLREANPGYNSAEGHLLYARSLELQSKIDAALEEYAALTPYYPGQEARCRYGLLLHRTGRLEEARRLFQEICSLIEYGPRHQRRAQREWYGIAKQQLSS